MRVNFWFALVRLFKLDLVARGAADIEFFRFGLYKLQNILYAVNLLPSFCLGIEVPVLGVLLFSDQSHSSFRPKDWFSYLWQCQPPIRNPPNDACELETIFWEKLMFAIRIRLLGSVHAVTEGDCSIKMLLPVITPGVEIPCGFLGDAFQEAAIHRIRRLVLHHGAKSGSHQ
jgi:hypothetical protein